MASTPGARALGALLVASLAFAAHSTDTLAVRVNGEWLDWWRADGAPAQWTQPSPTLGAAIR
jgi:hypothetical protein